MIDFCRGKLWSPTKQALNFGGAYLQKEMKGVLGFIVRDRKGSQVTTGVREVMHAR